jgi:hypothetical protein
VLALVDKYYKVDEAIATNPKVPLKRYYEVAGGDYAQSLLQAAQLQRAKDYKVIGKERLGPTKVRGIVNTCGLACFMLLVDHLLVDLGRRGVRQACR